MIKILTSFLFISFPLAKTHHYQVEFMGINVAKVSMAHRDTIFANHPSSIIEFSAKTEAVSNFFYPVNNHYEIIHANDSYQILSFKKTTTQPGLYNELFTNLNDELPYYHNSKISISKEAITIFTLLHLLANGLLDEENYTIEREGLYYDALLLNLPNQSHLQKYKLNLTAIPSAHKIAILKDTDIFTWAVFKQNASRTIWVNATDQKIQKCNFNIGLFNLTAKYLFTDE